MIQPRRRGRSLGSLQNPNDGHLRQPNPPLDASSILKKLEEDRMAYQDSLTRTHELLAQVLNGTSAGFENILPLSSDGRLQRNSLSTAAQLTRDQIQHREATLENSVSSGGAKNQGKSSLHGEDESKAESDTDDDEELFVQEPLPAQSYSEESLEEHIRSYKWTASGYMILDSILKSGNVHPIRFPTSFGPVDDRSHLSHYTILDVFNDGAIKNPPADHAVLSRARAIWMSINHINSDLDRQRKAVGRITIIREPSPLLFAALHHTLNEHFDMDEMFALLTINKIKAFPHRPWSTDIRHRQTFVVALNYFTIVGDGCQPMAWQSTMDQTDDSENYIPIAQCSSVIGLSLRGEPVKRVKNRSRALGFSQQIGDVYDPFSPWHVLSITAHPDWKHSIDYNPTRHYVNGTEAFLVTLHAEFKDAHKRLMSIHHSISELVSTPADSMFRRGWTDRLFFDDDDFSYLRRYTWASQILSAMSETIHEMRITYQENFTAEFWDGTSKTIWPTVESMRHHYWRKRMSALRMDIEKQIHGLEALERLNNEKTREIATLRQNLSSSTSVVESRKAVLQGQNIKTLTLVTIFFLPLMFVTSIFGMTNMNPTDDFSRFGIVLVVVSLPTYMIIGLLNLEGGIVQYLPRWITQYLGPKGSPVEIPLKPMGKYPKLRFGPRYKPRFSRHNDGLNPLDLES
ncbi:MAG: hypothetical protein Q9222_002043 [Ikaeria aurantiellina]